MSAFKTLARRASGTYRNREVANLIGEARSASIRTDGPKRIAGAAPDEADFAGVRSWYQDITPEQKAAVLAGLLAAGNFVASRDLLNASSDVSIDHGLISLAGERFAEIHGGQSLEKYIKDEFADPDVAHQIVDNFVSRRAPLSSGADYTPGAARVGLTAGVYY